jgi:hypothetical protein
MIRVLSFITICLFAKGAYARGGDSSTIVDLNIHRLQIDRTGMRVLGAWGLASTVAGVAGAVSAKDEEWKRFHQMNAVWGIVNLGIAGLGYMGAGREMKKSFSNTEALHAYESDKRLYLINGGLDVLYIASGVFLTEHAKHSGDDAAMYRGFGKSLILQGAGLLLFDASMFLAHNRQDKAWYKALQGVCITGDGIGWRYAIR